MTTTQTKFVVARHESQAWLLYASEQHETMFESFTDAINYANQLTTQTDDQFNVYLIKAHISNIHIGEDLTPKQAALNVVTMVDPPSGWKYGFPAPLKEDYKQQLLDAGYPEKDIELALTYSRYWETAE